MTITQSGTNSQMSPQSFPARVSVGSITRHIGIYLDLEVGDTISKCLQVEAIHWDDFIGTLKSSLDKSEAKEKHEVVIRDKYGNETINSFEYLRQFCVK